MSRGGGIVTEPGSKQGIHLQENRIDFLQQQVYEDNTGRSASVTFDESGQSITNVSSLDKSTQYIQTIVYSPDNKQEVSAYQYVIDFMNMKKNTSTDTYAGGQITIRSELPQNSDAEKYPIGISFVDTTIDPENPSKVYRLKDFALKSDIPSGVDLTSYEGDWSLTKSIENGSYTKLETGIDSGFAYQHLYSKDSNDEIYGGFFTYGGQCFTYMTVGFTLSDVQNNTVNNGEVQISYPGIITSQKYENGVAVSTSVIGCTSTGIKFKDTTIQQDQFTLKSLVDRIAALETQVTELQSQLAAKANTASPTFTGKVSINNSN